MADIYIKRFIELQNQMESLISSKKSKYNSFLEKNEIEIDANGFLEWTTKIKNLLNKACGKESEHYIAFIENDKTGTYDTYLETLERLRAIFLAAKEDYEGGYLRTVRSLIQAEVYDSQIEQANTLLDAGYTSPAAVVIGVVLETSIKDLCDRNSISHSRLDKMNSDLAKIGVYNTLQQKRITALADIRNSAAHGDTGKFSVQDVKDMIRDVERFLSEYL